MSDNSESFKTVSGGRIQCPSCQRTYASIANLRNHIDNKHRSASVSESSTSERGQRDRPETAQPQVSNSPISGKGKGKDLSLFGAAQPMIEFDPQVDSPITGSATQVGTSPAAPPTVDEIKNWDKNQLISHLQGKLYLDKEDLNILFIQKIGGDTLLDLTEERLERWGMAGGPAMRIIKYVNELKGTGLKRPASASSGGGRKKTKLIDSQAPLLNDILKMQTPSSASMHSNFKGIQKRKTHILNGRPSSHIGPPIVLYEEIFGRFLDDLKYEKLAIDDTVISNTLEIIRTAAELYDLEKDRVQAMNNVLTKICGSFTSINNLDGTEVDAIVDVTINGLSQRAALVIGEYKNEIGTGGRDPTIQGGLAYSRYWAQSDHEEIRRRSRCPSFIIGIAGPWICVLGAVFLQDTILIEPLTEFISLTQRPRNDRRLKELDRLFEALRRGIKDLSNYYQSLATIPRDGDYRFFPYFQPRNDTLTYTAKLSEDRMKLIWKATSSRKNVTVVVKFVEAYCEEAHRLCAKFGLAPNLYGVHNIPGGYKVVIMEYINGTSLDLFPRLRDSMADSKAVYADVEKAIRTLHKNDFVFADLRLPNILAIRKNDGNFCAMLVDFDWCGKRLKDKYPRSMNLGLKWPKDVKPGSFLHFSDDVEWLMELKNLLNLS